MILCVGFFFSSSRVMFLYCLLLNKDKFALNVVTKYKNNTHVSISQVGKTQMSSLTSCTVKVPLCETLLSCFQVLLGKVHSWFTHGVNALYSLSYQGVIAEQGMTIKYADDIIFYV